MTGQNQIRRRLSGPDGIEQVSLLLAEGVGVNRTELADRVCDILGFVDARGQRQRGGCLKALRVLEERGCFVLPTPRTKSGPPQPRCLESGVPLPREVPGRVDLIRGLELVRVKTEEQMRVWNSLFLDEHPRGAGPLVGRQLRYLIGSEHGWLGGLGFAAAALNLGARDRWIGWDVETRRVHLERVVGMARFLIRPSVRCQNLASRVLSLAMARVGPDFEERYGYQPWLVETFVDTSQVSGTCYRAANWTKVGSSQGRGRQDVERKRPETIKDIYVYVLANDFRARLALPAHPGQGPLSLDAGLEAETWAEQEFGGAPLGDGRLCKRLVKSAAVQAESPMLPFPDAAGGDVALVKGHYRLIDQADELAVTMENLLLPHRGQTTRRMMAHKTVLCIQGGTDLDYNGALQGLGEISTHQAGGKSLGLHLHSTLAVTDHGLPLGLLRAQCQAPEAEPASGAGPAPEIPTGGKGICAWTACVRDCESVAAGMPHTRILQVMDCGADLFEVFDEWRQGARRTHLLVRAHCNGRSTQQLKLFEGIRAAEPLLRLQLHVDRQSARPGRRKEEAHPARTARTAETTLRRARVELRPPRYHRGKKPIPLTLVHLLEETPPVGVTPMEWFLMTTKEVTTPEQVERLVGYYCQQPRIDDWHQVLKRGCRVEDLRNRTVERLKRAIAIHLVIAWRIMLMRLLGREVPGQLPEVLYSDIELGALEVLGRT